MQECLYCLLSSFFLPHGDKIKHASLFLVGGLRGQNDVYVMCLKGLFFIQGPCRQTRQESKRVREHKNREGLTTNKSPFIAFTMEPKITSEFLYPYDFTNHLNPNFPCYWFSFFRSSLFSLETGGDACPLYFPLSWIQQRGNSLTGGPFS